MLPRETGPRAQEGHWVPLEGGSCRGRRTAHCPRHQLPRSQGLPQEPALCPARVQMPIRCRLLLRPPGCFFAALPLLRVHLSQRGHWRAGQPRVDLAALWHWPGRGTPARRVPTAVSWDTLLRGWGRGGSPSGPGWTWSCDQVTAKAMGAPFCHLLGKGRTAPWASWDQHWDPGAPAGVGPGGPSGYLPERPTTGQAELVPSE